MKTRTEKQVAIAALIVEVLCHIVDIVTEEHPEIVTQAVLRMANKSKSGEKENAEVQKEDNQSNEL